MKEIKEISEPKEISEVPEAPTADKTFTSKSNLKLISSLIALIIIPYGLFLSVTLLKGLSLISAMKYVVRFFVAFHVILAIVAVVLDFTLDKSLGKHSDGEAFLKKIFNKFLVLFAFAVMFLVITLATKFTFVESNEFLNILVAALFAAIYMGFSVLGGLSLIIFRKELRIRKIIA